MKKDLAEKKDPTLPEDETLAIFADEENQTQIVKLEQGKPVEWLSETGSRTVRRLDLYLGEIRDIKPSLKAVFIDIGQEQPGFLPLGECAGQPRVGQPLLVQIKKRCDPPKGHQLTTRFQFPGPYAVLREGKTPLRRSKLKQWAPSEQDRLFEQDLNRLSHQWRIWQEEAAGGPRPRLLAVVSDVLDEALFALLTARTQFIWVEGTERYTLVYDRLKKMMPDYLPRLKLHLREKEGFSLAAVLGLSQLKQEISSKKIYLKKGGFLVIEKTEALTVIDVNSGKDTRGKDKQELVNRVNREAAKELARQLRLRNIGGIVLIDFINMTSDRDRQALEDWLRDCTRLDRARFRLYGYTHLGLYEMTRTAI